jgi:hypothetical protein
VLFAERAEDRFLARRVGVEREDDLAESGGVVGQDPAHDLDVVDAERRSAGGDRGRDAGEMARHDVGVALDDHDLVAARDVALGEVEPVEHL